MTYAGPGGCRDHFAWFTAKSHRFVTGPFGVSTMRRSMRRRERCRSAGGQGGTAGMAAPVESATRYPSLLTGCCHPPRLFAAAPGAAVASAGGGAAAPIAKAPAASGCWVLWAASLAGGPWSGRACTCAGAAALAGTCAAAWLRAGVGCGAGAVPVPACPSADAATGALAGGQGSACDGAAAGAGAAGWLPGWAPSRHCIPAGASGLKLPRTMCSSNVRSLETGAANTVTL
eukprot:7136977-Pyramimonas_sp.AAC.2